MNNSDNLTILLIEDDFDHAELAKRTIKKYNKNIKIIHVKSGEKAIDYLDKKCKKDSVKIPNLIFLDLRLPGIDGIDILRLIKNSPELKDAPIVILSTSGYKHDRELAERYKANIYLVKPLEYDDFVDVLTRLKLA